MTSSTGRFALYFAPAPESALARFGASWLGYDAVSGDERPQPRLATISAARLTEITAEPRIYGFHATLKPPFALAENATVAALDRATAEFAARLPAFTAPALALSCISGFWALTLSSPSPGMDELAAVSVARLDAYRAPPGVAELEKRRRARLSPAQELLLQRWGYPYVMAEFRFHMTLSARLDTEEGDVLRQALTPLVEPLCREALPVDAICLFHQPAPGARFRMLKRYRLTG